MTLRVEGEAKWTSCGRTGLGGSKDRERVEERRGVSTPKGNDLQREVVYINTFKHCPHISVKRFKSAGVLVGVMICYQSWLNVLFS